MSAILVEQIENTKNPKNEYVSFLKKYIKKVCYEICEMQIIC